MTIFWTVAYSLVGFLYLFEWIVIYLGYYHPTLERTASVSFLAMAILFLHLSASNYTRWEKEKESSK